VKKKLAIGGSILNILYPVLNKNILLFLSPDGGIIGKLGGAAVSLNKTASEILELCNGSNTKEQIAQSMALRYHEDYERVLKLTENFLTDAINKEHVHLCSDQNPSLGFIGGNKEYHSPIEAIVELTSMCNLKCIHCYANAGSTPENTQLDTEKLFNIFLKVKELGAYKVTLTGGDPLAHSDFFRILELCCKIFLSVDIATNGYNVTEEKARKIRNLQGAVVKCNISVDGNEKTHDYIRGVKGSWNRAIGSIRYLRKYSISVRVGMTLNPYNLTEIEDVIQIVKENGAHSFELGMTVDAGRAVGKNLHLTKEQKDQTEILITQLAAKYGTDFFLIKTSIGDSSPESLGKTHCGALNRSFFIDHQGNIKPCGIFNHSLGNFDEIDLFNLYRSSIINLFCGLKHPSKDLCGDCMNYYLCNGCLAVAEVKSKQVKDCAWLPYWNDFIKYTTTLSKLIRV